MKYPYHDYGPGQFEDLVVAVCSYLLGAGIQGFATGVDGGRDAKFVGTAELLPSKANPWDGTVIVQAKHTNGYNKTFSDADFHSDESTNTVLGAELPRIKKLRAANALDYYMLFANRRLTGNGEAKLRALIAKECGLAERSVMLCGVEQLELWLRRFPHAAKIANIDPIDAPLIVNPDELAEIVEHLAEHLPQATLTAASVPTGRTSYDRKNALNGMTAQGALALRKNYLKETAAIRSFLADPQNDRLLRLYEATVEEFQLKIIAKRKQHQSFDEVFNYVVDLVFERDPILRANKRLTRTMLFYMYWNCDIGVSDDAPS